MNVPQVMPGDIFVVHTQGFICKGILAVEKFWSPDGDAQYNHAGIILDDKGNTFESLARIRRGHILDYQGHDVWIARHNGMSQDRYFQGWEYVRSLEGNIYPVLRLALFMTGLAKFFHWEFAVCSELALKFLVGAGLEKKWWGFSPDYLADSWCDSKNYSTVWKGVL